MREYDPGAVFELASVDAVGCFGTIYFFDPRHLESDRCLRVLKPGAKLILECNNAASLLRGIRVVLGRNNTNTFQEYFFDNVAKQFWVKSDVQALADYLKLSEYRLAGRNWSLYQSRKRLPEYRPYAR